MFPIALHHQAPQPCSVPSARSHEGSAKIAAETADTAPKVRVPCQMFRIWDMWCFNLMSLHRSMRRTSGINCLRCRSSAPRHRRPLQRG
eukprot:symbB.v1.2.024121.t1/scaffold2261.1/size84172/2